MSNNKSHDFKIGGKTIGVKQRLSKKITQEKAKKKSSSHISPTRLNEGSSEIRNSLHKANINLP
jgi:hypothetical protein